MEVKPHTLIKGDIYYSCGENSCKPKRMYAQFGVEQEANSQKETFHLSLSDVTQKKHVRKKAIWRHHDFCGIVDGDLTLPMTGCWFRGQKRSKMTYIAMCLEGKTIMLFSKDQPQQTINGNTLSKWKQTLFGAMKCVANWYVVYTGSTVHVADLEEGSQMTLALTESGLGLLSNSLEMTSRPPHSVRRWSLSHVRCEQQDDNIVKLYAKENGIKGEYTFRTNHCVAVVKAVEAAHANYVRSRKTSSASSSSETTSWQFTESLYDETEQSRISTESEQDTTESIESEHSRTELETALKMRLSHSDDTHVIPTEHLSVSDDDKRADALLDCCDLTFSRRSRSTGCLASNTKMNPPDMYDIDRRCRRSHDNLFTASCSCNINDLAADVKRLQNHRAIYSQMNTIVRTAAIHCNSVTSSGVIETVSPLATRRSTLKKRFAKPVVSLTLSLPAQSFDDSVIEGQHSQGKKTQPKERSHSRSSSRPSRFSLYRSISEHDLIQPQSPGDWSAESICRCLNDVLNNHPPLPDTLHLPCKLRIQVCMRLYTQEDDAKGWKALAEKIGLNYDAVMIIQSFQHHHPCRLTAGEIVLRHWQSVFNSCGVDPLKCPVACTKDKLGVLLLEIGRFDLVDLLS